jgi:CubicO group peptidase (beta-lactamase class C family)
MSEFITAKLHALGEGLAAFVEGGHLPGLVALVARDGDPHVIVAGKRAVNGPPMMRDSIFRIASLTKPITALAALTFVEDGTTSLDAHVDEVLPELADRRVLRAIDGAIEDTVPAERPITLEDLLTCRMGFGIALADGPLPIVRAEHKRKLGTLGVPRPPTPLTADEWLGAFAELPLMYQPGSHWNYNTSSVVLGIFLARLAGQSLETVLAERVFQPLGMVDTSFVVPDEKRDRLTTAYAPEEPSGALTVTDEPETSYWNSPPALENGAAGLVSTIDDFWKFARTIRDRGVFSGGRIISEDLWLAMTTDQLTAEQRAANTVFLGPSGGWGLGLSTWPATSGSPGQRDGVGWSGGTGTTWRTDFDRQLTGILFSQREMTSPEPPELFSAFFRLAYEALG